MNKTEEDTFNMLRRPSLSEMIRLTDQWVFSTMAAPASTPYASFTDIFVQNHWTYEEYAIAVVELISNKAPTHNE